MSSIEFTEWEVETLNYQTIWWPEVTQKLSLPEHSQVVDDAGDFLFP